eukprot:11563190-Karenia_brevis.AAC.1
MPDSQNGREAASRLYCLYMRPWTLDQSSATADVSHISMLDNTLGQVGTKLDQNGTKLGPSWG